MARENKSKAAIIDILMRRDGLSREEAAALLDDVLTAVCECDDPDEMEEIWTDELGLEIDYLLDLVSFG